MLTRFDKCPTSHDPITTNDPTLPPGTTRSPAYVYHTITFDPAMRRQRKAYEAEVRKSQQVLTEMAEETGGQIFLPKTGDEMIAQAREAAREVGAEYVVTYRPKTAARVCRAGRVSADRSGVATGWFEFAFAAGLCGALAAVKKRPEIRSQRPGSSVTILTSDLGLTSDFCS